MAWCLIKPRDNSTFTRGISPNRRHITRVYNLERVVVVVVVVVVLVVLVVVVVVVVMVVVVK
jgi:hypothetical protein